MRARFMLPLVLAACGDPLVGADFRGEPLFEIEGVVRDFESTNSDRGELRASLFWSTTGDSTTNPDELLPQPYVSAEVAFLVAFQLDVFQPPPDDERLFPDGRPYAVGMILVHDDTGELRGGADFNAVLYAREEVAAEDSPTERIIPRGYSLAMLPLPCWSPGRPRTVGTDDCEVPLGAACALDADCGKDGICLTDQEGFSETFPGGYCAQWYRRDGCAPKTGVLEPEYKLDAFNIIEPEFWYKGCQRDADCRVDEGYVCEFELGVCWPEIPAEVVILPDFEMAPFCR